MLSSAPTRAPQMKPPQVLGSSCPGSSSCTAAPQVTEPNKNQSCSSNPSTGDNSDPAGGHLLLQALMTLGSREEGGSPIRMQGNVRGSLQPLSREQSLDPIRDFPANTTSWRRGGFALVKQQKPRAEEDLMEQKHNSAGTSLVGDSEKIRAAFVPILIHLLLQTELHLQISTKPHTQKPTPLALLRNNSVLIMDLPKLFLNCCCDRRVAEAVPAAASLG